MSHRRDKGRNKSKPSREPLENYDEDNPTIKMFQVFSAALDEKHDRYERIVKLSRDITIESKRIIFLLHSKGTENETKREQLLVDAKERLDQLVQKSFQQIAIELEGHDPYQYLRAYTAGLQEFIEALVFYQYVKEEKIDNWSVINDSFIYKIKSEGKEGDEVEERVVTLLFPQLEFILGIADFTGELMRKCINNLGAGRLEDCFKICEFVKYILTGFIGINTSTYKEIGRKLYVLRQSLSKMEMVCYNIKVRGSEVPKHTLALVASAPAADYVHDEDEGFY